LTVTATIARQTSDLRADVAREIAVEAYVYLFPPGIWISLAGD
jgi:hypothetical protein